MLRYPLSLTFSIFIFFASIAGLFFLSDLFNQETINYMQEGILMLFYGVVFIASLLFPIDVFLNKRNIDLFGKEAKKDAERAKEILYERLKNLEDGEFEKFAIHSKPKKA